MLACVAMGCFVNISAVIIIIIIIIIIIKFIINANMKIIAGLGWGWGGRVNNVVGLFMHGPCTYVLGGVGGWGGVYDVVGPVMHGPSTYAFSHVYLFLPAVVMAQTLWREKMLLLCAR